jgi:adenylylsulfate kinase
VWPRHGGATIWLTGLPSSGKSTLAAALAARLRAERHQTQILDGDEVRAALSPELGFSRADRVANMIRLEFVARLLTLHGVKVIVASIAPYADARALVRKRHEAVGARYLEVYVSTPLHVCAQRDAKGLYAHQRTGRLSGLTGVDDVFEPPSAPDLEIDTSTLKEDTCFDLLVAHLTRTGLM